MTRYTIDVRKGADDISPVAAAVCGYCKSIVLIVGSVNADVVNLPLVCEQDTTNLYSCGGSMALVRDNYVRETLDNIAAHLQKTDS